MWTPDRNHARSTPAPKVQQEFDFRDSSHQPKPALDSILRGLVVFPEEMKGPTASINALFTCFGYGSKQGYLKHLLEKWTNEQKTCSAWSFSFRPPLRSNVFSPLHEIDWEKALTHSNSLKLHMYSTDHYELEYVWCLCIYGCRSKKGTPKNPKRKNVSQNLCFCCLFDPQPYIKNTCKKRTAPCRKNTTPCRGCLFESHS